MFTARRQLVLLVVAGAALLPAAPAKTKGKPTIANPLQLQRFAAESPIRFEPNVGQAGPEVRYIARGAEYTMLLTGNETVMALGSETIRMKLLSGRVAAASRPEDLLGSVSNYYIGNDPKQWHPAVPNYGRVRFNEVYPGIDIVYYGNQRHLEYDFVVKPGADPGQIRLSFSGADSMKVNSRGDLVLAIAGRELIQRKPSIYQEVHGKRVEVAGQYSLFQETGEVKIALAQYDRKRALVIDPVIVYSTYLGGSGSWNGGPFFIHDLGLSIAADKFGATYVSGQAGGSFPTLNSNLERGTILAAKYDATGKLVYATSFGGGLPNEAQSRGIAVDSSGNAYLTGVAEASVPFPVVNAAQPLSAGWRQAFVTKLSPSGTIVYSTYLGGPGWDYGNGIAVDSTGAAFVTGTTSSGGFPQPLNAFVGCFNGPLPPYCGSVEGDAFLTKINPSGSFAFTRYFGGSRPDTGKAVATDPAGMIYVTGDTVSIDFPTQFNAQLARGSGQEAFVVKLTNTGDPIYSTYLGGSGDDFGYGIAADSTGSAYVTGTAAAGFPLKSPAQGSLAGSTDAFITKFSPNGAFVYSSYFGGPGAETGAGVAVDSTGAAYITGYTDKTGLPIFDAPQAAYGGKKDAFVAKFDPDGFLAYSSYIGGVGDEVGNGIATGLDGSAYIVGTTDGGFGFPIQLAQQPAFGGGTDAFVTKISPSAPISTARITGLTPPYIAAGSASFTLTVSGTGFANLATVRWNGQQLLTSVTSSTSASALVPSSLLVGVGSAAVTIQNPNETKSNAGIVSISNLPQLGRANLNYTLSTADGTIANRIVTVDGSNFLAGARAAWNGFLLSTSLVTGGLSAIVPANLLQIPGPANLTVENPSDGPSSPLVFNVPPLRTITGLSPNTGAPGAAFSFLVNGTGFSPADKVKMASTAIATTATSFVSSTQLRVTATAPTSAVYQVWVETADTTLPGGGTALFPSNQVALNVAGVPVCGYTLNGTSASFPVTGGNGTVSVAAPSICNWSASTGENWITVTAGASGTGNGPVTFTVAVNTSPFSRSGTLTIAGQTYTVQQAGTTCTYGLNQASQSFPFNGGSGSVSLSAPTGCSWTAVASSSWITLNSTVSGTGPVTINFSISANTAASARSGSIDVAGLRFAISQAGVPAGAGCVVNSTVPPSLSAEGLTEPLADLTINCSGFTASTTANVRLSLSTTITNKLTAGQPDVVLTINGTPAPAGTITGAVIQWNGVAFAAGTNILTIRNVRANTNLLGASSSLIDGTVTLNSATSITVTNPTPILGVVQPGLLFQKGQPSPPAGGLQTIVPITFREGSAGSFKTAQANAGGTRLRLVVSGIPSTVSVYASVFPAQGAGAAQLYSADSNGLGGSPSAGSLLAGLGYYQLLPVNAGSAAATWEVFSANPTQIETLNFSLLLTNASSTDLANIGVSGGFAPVDTTAIASETAPVPRYAGTGAVQKVSQLRLTLDIAPATNAAASVKKTVGRQAAYSPGSNIPFALTILNESDDSAGASTNVVVQSNLAPGLTLVSCSSTVTCTQTQRQIRVAFANIGPLQKQVINLVAQVDSGIADGTVLDNWAAAGSNEVNADPSAVIAKLGITVVIGAPVSPTPSDNATGVTTTPAFSWSAVNGATGYDFYLGTDNTFAGGPLGVNLTATSYTTTALLASTKYYWKVVAKGPNGDRSSEIWTFTTSAPPAQASLTAPLAGNITGPSVTFTWNAIATAAGYWLDVGTAAGSGNLCASAQITALTYTCNNIPTTAGPVFVQLFTKIGTVWQAPRSYTFTSTATTVGGNITTPAPGTQLPSTTVNFVWSAVANATAYWLDIGTAIGSGNICASSAITATNYSCSSIPTTVGATIHAQLWSQVAGVWSNKKFTYAAPPPTTASPAALTSPAANTTIAGSSITFTWSTGTGVDAYWLDVGTAAGIGDISSGQQTAVTKTVSNLPANTAPVYVRLWSRSAASGAWLVPNDYVFQRSTEVRATLQSPASGVLPNSTVTFTWTAGVNASEYWLDVGPTAGSGAYSAGSTTALSKTVTGLPCTGGPAFVGLWTKIAGVWQPAISYPFTLPSVCIQNAQLTAPTPGSTINGTTATFTWSAGPAGTTNYWLDVGTSAGSGNISGGASTGLTRTVTNLPGNGQPLYVRLWTFTNGAWQTPNDYVFQTGSSPLANLTAPTPGSRITGASATFTWTAGGAGVDGYWLDVGTAAGSGNLSNGLQTTTTKTVTNLPNNNGNSTVYVRLWTRIGGAWQTPIDYTFTN